jgi:Extracellular tail, of 10TM putative phosphate transporter
MGLSKALLEESHKAGLEGSDKAAWVNEKGKVEWDMHHPQKVPTWKARRIW